MIAIKGMKMPSSCKACPFLSYGLCYATSKVSDIKVDIHNDERYERCPLVEVKTLDWNHTLTPEEINWRNKVPNLYEYYLAYQAGDAFIKTIVNEDLIQSKMEQNGEEGLRYFAKLTVVAE